MADTVQTNVDVSMPYFLDVSGLTAVLFGEAPSTLTGELITVHTSLPVRGLFDGAKGWIHYIQDASENTYRALINQERALVLNADLSGCVNLREGSTYSATSQSSAVALVPATTAVPFAGYSAPWDKYNSIQDMVVSYFGIKILGHPGALAAISNDSALRAAATSAVTAGFEQIYGVSEIACKDAAGAVVFGDLAAINSAASYTHGYANGTANIMTEQNCLDIIEQMMNADPYRFRLQDKNKWEPLQWFSGDVLRFQLNIKNNSYTVRSGGQSSLVSGGPGALVQLADDLHYQLKFTVA